MTASGYHTADWSDPGPLLQRRRRRLPWLALWVLRILLAIAGLAPFLTNDAPLVYRSASGVEWPVLAELSAPDAAWLGLLVVLAAVGGATRWLRRGGQERRRAVQAWHLGGLVLLLIWLGAVARWPNRLHPDRWTAVYQQAPETGDFWVRTPFHHGPYAADLLAVHAAPSRAHPMGTDGVGRDVLARCLYGARVSLGVGVGAMALALLIGLSVGVAAGYCGGWVDLVLSRVMEVFLCFPTLFLVLIVAAYLPPSVFALAVVLGLRSWVTIARLTRGEFLRWKNAEFVEAARVLGARPWRVVTHHILPQALAPILVAATLGISTIMIVEASLTYLGLGVPPPTPSWGELLQQGQASLSYAPWITLFPGLLLSASVCAYNFLGEGLRDVLDPRQGAAR